MSEMSEKEQAGPLEELTEILLPGTVVLKDPNLCLFLTTEDIVQ